MNVYLVGYRGAGKTTAAPLVAARLRLDWLDLDAEIERRECDSVAALFSKRGEADFRNCETRALQEADAAGGRVVATGGGIVLRTDNRELLRRGFSVWLRASVDTLVGRLIDDATRPRLTNLPLREETERLIIERQPLYQDVANAIVDVDGLDAPDVAERIVAAVQRTTR